MNLNDVMKVKFGAKSDTYPFQITCRWKLVVREKVAILESVTKDIQCANNNTKVC